jgi:hypothetical protein
LNQPITFAHFSLIAEEKRMYARVLKSVGLVLALASVALIPISLAAQVAPTAKGTPHDDSASKWDIFAGYSYLTPHGTVNTPLENNGWGPSIPGTMPNTFHQDYEGGIIAIARFFNPHVGLEMVGDVHFHSEAPVNGVYWANNDLSGGQAGLIYRWPGAKFTPFVHVTAGGEVVGGPHYQLDTGGPAATVGAGLDFKFSPHVSVRLAQADYQYAHVNWGSVSNDDDWGGVANVNAIRLSAGIVFHAGTVAPPTPIAVSCTPSAVSIFPGDPVTVTATPGSVAPKLNTIYSWSGPAGATGSGTSVTIATSALAPGSYTVSSTVKEGKAGKEGLKPWETATCSASFTVKAFEPPTISCSASPSTMNPGGTATITASGVSPQNRPLTYSYSATAGAISGSGTTATFNSVGAPTGAVGITCNVADDKGQTATANTSVTITAPYVAPIPHTQSLCSISFANDKERPTRVDNEAKACLDEIALGLQKQSDAKAVIVGESDAKEKAKTEKETKAAMIHKHLVVENFAAQRAVNTKEYLVTDKGIDASRIVVATSGADGQKVEDYLVPSGATFTDDVAGTTPVDETAVKPVVRKPLPAKHHHSKKTEK